jgi:threonine/homoserine/homoserine lactone efflux protein
MPIDTAILPLFLSAVIALVLVPGPDFLLITTQATSRGLKYALACALGIALAGVLQTALVALGLGKLMETWPVVANLVRLAGAMYLAALGVSLLRAWWLKRLTVDIALAPKPLERSTLSLFFAGLVSNLLNPKALLFFSVFIPQFVNPSIGSSSIQIAILGVLLTLIALLYNLALSIVFAQFRHLRISRGAVARHGEGLVGVLFLFLAGRLAARN